MLKRIFLLIIVSLLVVNCGSKKRIVTKKKNSSPRTEVIVKTKTDDPNTEAETPDEIILEAEVRESSGSVTDQYISNYSKIAKEEMRKFKIPASITLAQGILESASGKGRLAQEANNHFGIKCHGWTGDKIYHDDDRNQECFRKYRHAEQSFEDHSEFLTGRSRYANLFSLDVDDYEGWAKGLRAAGYATDRKYPDKLISLIERYELYKYDEEVLGNPRKPRRQSVQRQDDVTNTSTHKVMQGDTLYSLSRRYNMTIQEIQRLNGMRDTNLKIGQLLIIKSK